MRPVLLDLFCCAGGAAEGYYRAGFDVIGVDNKFQRRYPFKFIQGDVFDLPLEFIQRFDAVHASPPCQGYSIATAGNAEVRARHPRMIGATRELLELSGLPYIIENVELARVEMVNPHLLCGRMFKLETPDADGLNLVLERHRLFETNWTYQPPRHPIHDDRQVAGVYGGARRSSKPNATPEDDRYSARYERKGGYVPRSKEVRENLLGIDWMTGTELNQAIPPVYTEHIGTQLLTHLKEK